MTPIPSNSSSLHLVTICFPICSWIFSSLNTGRTLARFPNNSVKHSGSFIPSLRKDTYGITSMLPNQNISIWMTPLPTKTPGTHQNFTTPSLVFSHQPQHPPNKTTGHIRYRHYLFLSRSTRATTLLKKNSRKNGKLYGRSSQSSQITPKNL